MESFVKLLSKQGWLTDTKNKDRQPPPMASDYTLTCSLLSFPKVLGVTDKPNVSYIINSMFPVLPANVSLSSNSGNASRVSWCDCPVL